MHPLAMQVLGLHVVDAIIIGAYILAVLAIGKIYSHGMKGQSDYFLGGRSLGKWFQFFLSFGSMADPGQATTTSSSVYRQGAGGAWLALITLFLTPYFWFTTVWFRRVRLTTTAELFEDRFGSKFLPTLYAVTTIIVAIVGIGGGNVVALKTLQPLMVKSAENYTPAEKQSVADYYEFVELRKLAQNDVLPETSKSRYDLLRDQSTRNQLQPYVTYLHPVTFYLVSSFLVAIFVMLGGLKASAVVDAVQALLVIVISFILIPFGIVKLGGFTTLHERVPKVMFNLFGGDIASEYTMWSIGALLFVQFVGIVGSQANMTISGSAKNEMAARLGAVTGGFSKRFITIAWAYCGLIAIALFGLNLSDSDQVWGLLTRSLLPVGLIGVMIIGILGGKLALLGAQSVVLSGLVVRNLYQPLFPGKSERHYMIIARVTVPVMLLLGIGVGLYLNSVVEILKFMIVLLVTWGAPITMIYLWRRLTETAVRVQVLATLLLIVVVPLTVPAISSLARSERLTAMTHERVVTADVKATEADVAAGLAQTEGQTITRRKVIEPVSLYFAEGVVRVNPKDPTSPKTGKGMFRVEVYLLSLLGVNVQNFTPSMLMTTRYMIDALLPLLILLVVSLMTRPTAKSRTDPFYARMKTPVGATLEQDALDVQASYANPTRYDHTKLFPKSNWEFTKWDKTDYLGFLGCCGLVVVVLIVFKLVLLIGS